MHLVFCTWFQLLHILKRYEDKRWASRDGNPKTSSGLREDKAPSHLQRPVEKSGHGYATVHENTVEERKKIQPSNAVPVTRRRVPAPRKVPEQVIAFLHVNRFFPSSGLTSMLHYMCISFIMRVNVMKYYYFWQ
jgi:hypothetical protein